MGKINDESMMPSLIEFFSHDYNFNILEEWIESSKTRANKKSLRVLDWLNTNYSKQYDVEYKLLRNGKVKVIYLWDKYNANLSSGYGKELFDPFGRGKKKGKTILLEHGEKILETTVAQLNYFRWAIRYGVIDYAEANLDAIYKDMHERSSRNRKTITITPINSNGSSNGSGNGRSKSKISLSKNLQQHDISMTITFNDPRQ
jgi:hypothetical protein